MFFWWLSCYLLSKIPSNLRYLGTYLGVPARGKIPAHLSYNENSRNAGSHVSIQAADSRQGRIHGVECLPNSRKAGANLKLYILRAYLVCTLVTRAAGSNLKLVPVSNLDSESSFGNGSGLWEGPGWARRGAVHGSGLP